MAVKKAEVETQVDPMDIIEPTYEPFLVDLGDNYIFYVKPLSFFGKIEFFSIMGKAVETVLSEDVSVTDLLDRDGDLPLKSAVSDADQFIVTISKIVQYAPEILLDLYCVILSVPKNIRGEVKEYIEENLDDETGFKILDVFIEQNAELMLDFFTKRIPGLATKISSKVQKSDQ